MTTFTRIAQLSAGLSMRTTILDAWKQRLVGWFYIGLACIVAFAIMFWVIPRFLPVDKKRRKRFARVTMGVLGLGLLLMLYSLLSGIGFGFGLGRGSESGGIGLGDGNTNEPQKSGVEGELWITVNGNTVYIDGEPVPIERVQSVLKKSDRDGLTMVLIDDYSDYGTYAQVETILKELLTEGKYKTRKEN